MEENRLYVGNLSFDSTEAELKTAFAHFGDVTTVNVVTDRDTGRPRGFAFVEMGSARDAKSAIAGLNESSLGGRSIQVSHAKPREARSGGGGRSRW